MISRRLDGGPFALPGFCSGFSIRIGDFF